MQGLEALEARMNEILTRLDESESPSSSLAQDTNPQSFQAMISMMQSQMLTDSLGQENSNSSFNPMIMMTGMSSMMMGSNPMSMLLQQGLAKQNISNENLPVAGRISSAYGQRNHPIHGHDHFHKGLDIAAPLGSPIKSPWDGKVVYVGNVPGFGANTVIVAHESKIDENGNIVYSIFGHNNSALVYQGQELKAGDTLATVGSEGNSTGPHVHWETRLAKPNITDLSIFSDQVSYTINPLELTA